MTEDAEKALSFWKQKQRLKMLHKRLRAGILAWEDVNEDDQVLLVKYYGWNP